MGQLPQRKVMLKQAVVPAAPGGAAGCRHLAGSSTGSCLFSHSMNAPRGNHPSSAERFFSPSVGRCALGLTVEPQKLRAALLYYSSQTMVFLVLFD